MSGWDGPDTRSHKQACNCVDLAALGRRLAAGPELSPYGVVREKERKTRKKPTLLKT